MTTMTTGYKMIVTDLKYHLETRLVNKLDIMAKRCTDKKSRKDAVLIVEGGEGEGKTNTSEAIAYYFHTKTKFPIYMFFRLRTMLEFAQSHENCIIIWDEPALDSLSNDWYKETNKDLIRLLMTCRKKRHFFMFNFVKFYKFTEYIVVDRALGMVHMYSRRSMTPGRFVYIKNKFLEALYNDYRKKKVRSYNKLKSFGGSFPIVEQYIGQMGINIEGRPNCSLEDYENLKDKAIQSIGRPDTVTSNPFKKKYNDLRYKVGNLTFPIPTKEIFANKIGHSSRTLTNWKNSVSNGDIDAPVS